MDGDIQERKGRNKGWTRGRGGCVCVDERPLTKGWPSRWHAGKPGGRSATQTRWEPATRACPVVETQTRRETERYRERRRHRETDTQRDRETDTQRDRETERQTETQRQRETKREGEMDRITLVAILSLIVMYPFGTLHVIIFTFSKPLLLVSCLETVKRHIENKLLYML